MSVGDLLQKLLIIGMIVSLPNSNIANSSHDDILICLNIPIPGLLFNHISLHLFY